MNYLIFDCEIEKAIPPKEGPCLPEIEYCQGWNDFRGMGLACVSVCWLDNHYSPKKEQYRPLVFRFDQDDAETQASALKGILKGAEQIGGFNSLRFDDKLLDANGFQVGTGGTSTFDILDMVLASAGQLGRTYWREGRKYNLDSICQANGLQKTGSGEIAPIWWQKGERHRVVEYCRNDAHIEREVLSLLLAGRLKDPNDGALLHWVSE